MQIIDTLFVLIILIFSAIVHEVMHGVAAERLGDKTARYAGRITLNPFPHIDPFGSIILPIILAFTQSPVWIAWAKPVPYNPYNLKPGRWSEALVAGAGPASNLMMALLAGLIIRTGVLGPEAGGVLYLVVVINVMLCFFNLIPVPPLDGSKILEAILPRSLSHKYGEWRHRMEMNPGIGMMVIILFILVFGRDYGTLIYSIAGAIAGFPA